MSTFKRPVVDTLGYDDDGALRCSYSLRSVEDIEAVFAWLAAHTSNGRWRVPCGPRAPYTRATGWELRPIGDWGHAVALDEYRARDTSSKWADAMRLFDPAVGALYFEVIFSVRQQHEDALECEQGMPYPPALRTFDRLVEQHGYAPDSHIAAVAACERAAVAYVQEQLTRVVLGLAALRIIESRLEFKADFEWHYTPDQWTKRGEMSLHAAVLYVTHDGPPVNAVLSDYNCDPAEYAKLNEELGTLGCYLQPVYSWATAVIMTEV